MLTPPPHSSEDDNTADDADTARGGLFPGRPDSPELPIAVRAVLHHIEQRWDQLRLPRAVRARLLEDLHGDLHAAYLDGITPQALLGTDEITFADDVATQLGFTTRRPPPAPSPEVNNPAPWSPWRSARALRSPAPTDGRAVPAGYGRVLVAAGLTTGLCVLVSLTAVLSSGLWLYNHGLGVGGPLVMYALFGALLIAAVLTVVHRTLRPLGRARETVTRAALLLPMSAVVSLPLAMYVGWVSDYSWERPVLAAEFGMVLGLAALALLIARRWALGDPPRQKVTAAVR